MRKYITIQAAAKMIGQSSAFVKTLIKTGKIESHTGKNKEVRVHSDSVETYLASVDKPMPEPAPVKDKPAKKVKSIEPTPEELEARNAAIKELQDEVAFYVECKEGFKGLSPLAVDFIRREIDKFIPEPRTKEMMMDFLSHGLCLHKMKDYGLTRERVRQILTKGFKQLFNRMKDFDTMVEINESLKDKNLELEAENAQLKAENNALKQLMGIKVEEANMDKLQEPIENLGFSVRATNCFQAEGIKNLADLQRFSRYDLMKFKNFGRTTLKETISIMHRYGVHLKGE